MSGVARVWNGSSWVVPMGEPGPRGPAGSAGPAGPSGTVVAVAPNISNVPLWPWRGNDSYRATFNAGTSNSVAVVTRALVAQECDLLYWESGGYAVGSAGTAFGVYDDDNGYPGALIRQSDRWTLLYDYMVDGWWRGPGRVQEGVETMGLPAGLWWFVFHLSWMNSVIARVSTAPNPWMPGVFPAGGSGTQPPSSGHVNVPQIWNGSSWQDGGVFNAWQVTLNQMQDSFPDPFPGVSASAWDNAYFPMMYLRAAYPED
jgi:hypothetical protein